MRCAIRIDPASGIITVNGAPRALFDHGIERLFVAAGIHDPAKLADTTVGIDHIDCPHAREAYAARANLLARGEQVSMATVLDEMKRDREDKGQASGPHELAWFDKHIASLPERTDPPIAGWERTILRFAARRRQADDAWEKEDREIDRSALDELDPGGAPPVVKPPAPRWHRAPGLVHLILKYAAEPLVPLKLGGDELAVIRAGGIVVVMGPTGAGKSSLVAGMLIAHDGPTVVLSRELPADELAARAIGIQCDASWLDVLTGKVPRHEMERALMPRLYVLDRKDATLGALVAAIEAAQLEYPGQQVLVAIDYVQILESSAHETRAKVADILSQIDDIARGYRVVVLAISQMSRASSRAARNGDALGADSTDGGAESGAIERFATMTLTIGASGPDRDDGTRTVELSIGKGRMTGGDRVLPMSYCGRSGRWRLEGDARSAADVRAERANERDSAMLVAAERAIAVGAAAAGEPVTREQLGAMAVAEMGRCPRDTQRQAIARLVASGALVEVQRKQRKARAWLLWTPDRAAAAGIPVVGVVGETSC